VAKSGDESWRRFKEFVWKRKEISVMIVGLWCNGQEVYKVDRNP
jgi:hypothetical protein